MDAARLHGSWRNKEHLITCLPPSLHGWEGISNVRWSLGYFQLSLTPWKLHPLLCLKASLRLLQLCGSKQQCSTSPGWVLHRWLCHGHKQWGTAGNLSLKLTCFAPHFVSSQSHADHHFPYRGNCWGLGKFPDQEGKKPWMLKMSGCSDLHPHRVEVPQTPLSADRGFHKCRLTAQHFEVCCWVLVYPGTVIKLSLNQSCPQSTYRKAQCLAFLLLHKFQNDLQRN